MFRFRNVGGDVVPRKIWIKCACGHEGTKTVTIHEPTSRSIIFPRSVCGRCGRKGAAVDMRVYWDGNEGGDQPPILNGLER